VIVGAGRHVALGAALVVMGLAPALACNPDRAEAISGLRADTPLVLAAPDGRRFRLLALAGEAAVPAERVIRIAPLGGLDRHERLPILALGADGPVETILLRDGRARLSPSRVVPRDCWRAMEAAETEAVVARRGIWAAPEAVLDAGDAEALKRSDGRFIVVTGRVRSVRTVRRITYVNFGAFGSGALTVTIAERDMAAFREFGLEPAAIRGHMLRVRGVVTIRRGPFIAAAMPEQITIAEAPSRGAR
jgi:hypothetical protein